jgi:hypothetical protein
MEINDLRRIATHPPPPKLWRTGSREKAQKAQRSGSGFAPGSRQLSADHRPQSPISKNRRSKNAPHNQTIPHIAGTASENLIWARPHPLPHPPTRRLWRDLRGEGMAVACFWFCGCVYGKSHRPNFRSHGGCFILSLGGSASDPQNQYPLVNPFSRLGGEKWQK